MSDIKKPESGSEEPDNPTEDLTRAMAEMAQRGAKIMQAYWDEQKKEGGFQVPDPHVIAKAFIQAGTRLMEHPEKLVEAQAQLMQDYANLWQQTARRLSGEEAEPVVQPAPDDKRFKDDAWTEEAVFDHIKQSYLLASNWLQNTLTGVEGLDDKTREKVDFYTRQYVDAWSPTNFALTNPKVLKETVDSKGENLKKGLGNLLADLEKGKGHLRISMTDAEAFKVGENIAATPGEVIYQNDLIQLIQYAPTTGTVHKRPLLIVPPWINKFYILDLAPKKSFVKWAVAQGHTVFMISWVNPGQDLCHKKFEDYMLEGPVAAMDAIEQATGSKDVNIVGYCIGGTLTACTLAYLTAKGEADRVKSATFFTTMTDFKDPGELSVFIDEEQIEKLEIHMQKKGYLDGSHMSMVFNLLRDKDLIWSFVINNYLLGRNPVPFDLLYWNSDNTRMPAMMHGMYLREMYLKNKLIEPGGITLAGVPLDLHKIKTPVYMVSAREDHIAPWKSTYAATQIYAGPVKFVLAGSGHIAGIINPAESTKYGYCTNAQKPKDPDAWLAKAKEHEGSWWKDWDKWVRKYAAGDIAARKPGSGKLKAIEPAPGSYVKKTLSD